MSLEAMVQCLSGSDTAKNIQAQVVLQSAPVLKNVRMSCMFTLPSGSFKTICSFLYNSGVRIHCLCRGRGREVLILYRENWLDAYLKQEEIATFLQYSGYQIGSLRKQLQRLGERIAGFYSKTQDFPHEMGLFLGYPLEDVRGFIEHRGAQCKCTGYWKVYSNEEHAKRMFRVFDEAKICAMEEFFFREKSAGDRLLM